MGCLYARSVGSNNSRTGLPTNALIKPEAVVPGLQLGKNFETNALAALASGLIAVARFSAIRNNRNTASRAVVIE